MAQKSRRRGAVIAASIGGGLVVATGTLYLVGHAKATDTIPAHTTVDGVAIGGLSSAQARDRLASTLGPRFDAPMTLEVGGTKATLTPSKAGLTADWRATVAQIDPGNSWSPRVIWNTLRGGVPVDPVTRIDRTALDAAVTATARAFEVKPTDATVKLVDARIVTTKAAAGRTLDASTTADRVVDVWRAGSARTVPAATKEIAPTVTDEAVRKLVTSKLGPTVSGPVTVHTAKGDVRLSVAQIAAATTISTKGGLSATTDVAKLYHAALDDADLAFTKPVDARIVLDGGKPVIKPSVDGEGITEKTFTKVVTAALTATGSARTVSAAIDKVPASFSTEKARAAGVKQVIGEFTTNFPYAAYRNTNLTLAANAINGTYLAPGDTFDMDRVLGPRNASRGYVDGWVIDGAKMTKEVAGGVSQSATTTFNAAFFAGMTDVEHHPHSLYFSRYPAGREATLYSGVLNLRFRNDTRYGVLMQAYTRKAAPGESGSITVKVWSTPTWDRITSTDLVKSNFTDGRTLTESGPDCHPQEPSQGFDVHYSRQFWKDGKVVRTEPFFWRYDPTDEIICK